MSTEQILHDQLSSRVSYTAIFSADVSERYAGDDEIRSTRLPDRPRELWSRTSKRGPEAPLDPTRCSSDMVLHCELRTGFLSTGNSFDNFNGDKHFGTRQDLQYLQHYNTKNDNKPGGIEAGQFKGEHQHGGRDASEVIGSSCQPTVSRVLEKHQQQQKPLTTVSRYWNPFLILFNVDS